MSQELDTYFSSLAIALEREEIDVDSAIDLMEKEKIFQRADGENIKILIRLSFMGSLMSKLKGDQGGYWIAKVAHIVSGNLTNPDIEFALEIGVGNAIVCSTVALVIMLSRMEKYSETIPYLQNILPILKDDDDIKGYLETLIQLGQTFLRLGHHTEAAKYFQKCVETLDNLSDADELLSENSSQDMVRIDNQNIFDFGPPSIVNLVDVQLLKLLLNEYTASSLLHSKKPEYAITYSLEAVRIWQDNELQDGYNPSIILRTLNTNCTILATIHKFSEAIKIGEILLKQSQQLNEKSSEMAAALILSFCHQEIGSTNMQVKYRMMAETLARQLQEENSGQKE